MVSHPMQDITFESKDNGIVSSAQTRRALRYRLEHGPNVGRRLTYHTQDIAGRGLLVERFSEVVIPRLQLLEQPHILDGDHRLVGEGLEERNLLVREGAYLLTSDQDPPNSYALTEQWYREHGPMVESALERSADRKFALTFRGEIVDMDGSSVRDRSPRRRAAIARDDFVEIGKGPVVRHEPERIAIHEANHGVVGPAHTSGALGDRGENWLKLSRRAADYPQDLTRRRLLLQRLLRFVEEADILNRNHGLVGEGLQERDLLIHKWPNLEPHRKDRPQRDSFPHQGDGQHRVMTEAALQIATNGEFGFRQGRQVGKVKGRAIDDRAGRNGAAHERDTEIGR
jgi:hypothetical protein